MLKTHLVFQFFLRHNPKFHQTCVKESLKELMGNKIENSGPTTKIFVLAVSKLKQNVGDNKKTVDED